MFIHCFVLQHLFYYSARFATILYIHGPGRRVMKMVEGSMSSKPQHIDLSVPYVCKLHEKSNKKLSVVKIETLLFIISFFPSRELQVIKLCTVMVL